MEDKCKKCNKYHLILIESKCKNKYCIKHQSPHKHKCTFNFKKENKCKLIEKNPIIIKDKINKI